MPLTGARDQRGSRMPNNISGESQEAVLYRLEIGAYSPQSIPMSRLADYLDAFADILGEDTYIHFTKLTSGSTGLNCAVRFEAVPKVRMRLAAVRAGVAPLNALDAERRINKLLREDGASGHLQEGNDGRRVLEFPGVKEARQEYLSVKQAGSITGKINRVGGSSEPFPVIMEADGRIVSGLNASLEIAKKLGARLFETVRVHGHGSWERDDEGQWNLKSFRITSFEPVDVEPLSEVLANIRKIADPYPAEAYSEILFGREEAEEW